MKLNNIKTFEQFYNVASDLDGIKFTKHGKNRYIFLVLDDNGEDVIDMYYDNISNENVISKMHMIGVKDCNRDIYSSKPIEKLTPNQKYEISLMKTWANSKKEDLNKDGYSMFNKSGYLASIGGKLKPKVVVIDMAQKEKHPLYIRNFYEK